MSASLRSFPLLVVLVIGGQLPGCSKPVEYGQPDQAAAPQEPAASPAEPPVEPIAAPDPAQQADVPPARTSKSAAEDKSEDTEPAPDLADNLDDFFGTEPTDPTEDDDNASQYTDEPVVTSDVPRPGDEAPPEPSSEPEQSEPGETAEDDIGELFGDLLASQSPPPKPVTPASTDPAGETPLGEQPSPLPPALIPETPVAPAPSEPAPSEKGPGDLPAIPALDPPGEERAESPDSPPVPEWSPDRPEAEEGDHSAATPSPPEETLTPTPAPTTDQPTNAEPNLADSLPPPKVTPTPETRLLPETPAPPKRPTLDIHNTRHLAWMLGAKLSLRAFPGSGTEQWEPGAVAEMLGIGAVAPIADDKPGDDQPGDMDARVAALLKVAGSSGAQLTKKYGEDHAALLEMAVKTNALAALYAQHPELAEPVAAAVEKAAVRAGVEAAVTRQLLQTLRSDPTPEELRMAVFAFQGVMEESLKQEVAAAP